jgi:Putative adhesin
MAALAEPAPQHRTPVPLRRALFALAGLFTLVAIGWAAVNLLDVASRHTTTERATYDGVRSLVIEDASDVRLVGVPASSSLQVIARVTEGLVSPDHSAERGGGGELRLSSSCSGFPSGWCGVDYTIRVPEGTVLSANASGGDIVAEHIRTEHPVELGSSAGDVTVTAVEAPAIALSSSAGDVEALDLSSPRVLAESSAGDVAVSLRTPPDRLLAQSSAGDVELLVPDVAYNVDADSSAGDEDDGRVTHDPDSDRELTARSSAGDVTVAVSPWRTAD